MYSNWLDELAEWAFYPVIIVAALTLLFVFTGVWGVVAVTLWLLWGLAYIDKLLGGWNEPVRLFKEN